MANLKKENKEKREGVEGGKPEERVKGALELFQKLSYPGFDKGIRSFQDLCIVKSNPAS